MKLALNLPIIEFAHFDLETWIGCITRIHGSYSFMSPIKDVLLVSHGNKVLPFNTTSNIYMCFSIRI